MEVQQAVQAEAAELARVEKLDAELGEAERELSQLGASSSELDGLEERYWHDFNDFQLQLRAHIDERDVLVNRVCSPAMAGIHLLCAYAICHSLTIFKNDLYHCIASTPEASWLICELWWPASVKVQAGLVHKQREAHALFW